MRNSKWLLVVTLALLVGTSAAYAGYNPIVVGTGAKSVATGEIAWNSGTTITIWPGQSIVGDARWQTGPNVSEEADYEIRRVKSDGTEEPASGTNKGKVRTPGDNFDPQTDHTWTALDPGEYHTYSKSSDNPNWVQGPSILVLGVDVDVDSDNNGTIEDADDPIEADLTKPGKIIPVNDGDHDGDGIPDYGDGWNRDADDPDDDVIGPDADGNSPHFTPLRVSLTPGLDLSIATLTFAYSESSPTDYQVDANGQHTPGPGHLRIWKKDADVARIAGDVVSNGTPYTPASLGFSDAQLQNTFYIEGITPTETNDGREISVTLKVGTEPTSPAVSDTVVVSVIALQWVDCGMNPVESALEVTQDDYAQYSRGQGEVGGPGGTAGPPLTTSFPYFADPYRVANLVFNPAGADGLRTLSCDMHSNVSTVFTNALDNTNSFLLTQLTPNSLGYQTPNEVFGLLVPDPPQGPTGQRKTFVAHVFNPIFGIEAHRMFYETGVGSDIYMTRRLLLVATLTVLPDPNAVDSMTATLTSDVPGSNGDLTTRVVALTETNAASNDFKSADGNFEVRLDRLGINGAGLANDFTASVWSTLLDVSEETVDALETDVATLEFRTELVADDPPMITSGSMALLGKTYYVKVTGDAALNDNPASVELMGVQPGANRMYKAGPNVLTVGGKKAEFQFVDADIPPVKPTGVTFGNPTTTILAHSGDIVQARVEAAGQAPPLAVAYIAVAKQFPFVYPYAVTSGFSYYKEGVDASMLKFTNKPALLSTMSVVDAGGGKKLRVTCAQGPDYNRLGTSFPFVKAMDGSDETNLDWDSAQVAIWWKGTVNVKVDNTRAVETGVIAERFDGRTVRTKAGATWTEDGDRRIVAEFDIPEGATEVTGVLVFTDIIFGRDDYVRPAPAAGEVDNRAGDIPSVIGSWTGSKHREASDLWSFKNNDGTNGTTNDAAKLLRYPDDHNRLPTKDERTAQVVQMSDNVLKPRVGYKIVKRDALIVDGVVGNAADTGYDVTKDE